MIIGISGKIGSGKDTVGKIIQFLTLEDEVFSKTNADIIADLEHNWYCASKSSWQIKKFADKLKEIVCILIGCTREQLEDREFKEKELGEEWWYWSNTALNICPKEYGTFPNKMYRTKKEADKARDLYTLDRHNLSHIVKPTPRILLQQIGTDLFRNQLHPNTWINSLMSGYKLEGGFEGGERTASDGGYYSVPSYKGEYPNWIITDVRFPNELKAIKDKEGITIRVNRFKEKDKVYWTDPDTTEFAEGANSGVYSIIKLYDEFCLLSNDVGSETEVPYDEIKLYIEGQHESETALDDAKFDYIVENNGTIEELLNKVKKILINEKII